MTRRQARGNDKAAGTREWQSVVAIPDNPTTVIPEWGIGNLP
ncbi:hypothetical protein [Halomonas qinghailakensis]|nr:hypothetical protein [Halomonas sp. ZZQ-149]